MKKVILILAAALKNMFKNFFTYPVFLVIFLSIIGSILFGGLVKYYYDGGTKFQSLQKTAIFFASVPITVRMMIRNKNISGDVITPTSYAVYENKKFFDKKLVTSPPREELILISRHDGDLGRSIVEIRELNTFEVLHSYLPDIEKIYERIDLSKDEFKTLKRDKGSNRFHMWHPLITSKGELIFQSSSPLVKIDLNSKIIWVNDEDQYNHSINSDEEGNIYVPSHKSPYSKVVSKYVGFNQNGFKDENDRNNYTYSFYDDAINILNQNGHLIYSKSVAEILIENGYMHRIFAQATFTYDPVHLNDIQPVLKDTQYFKKGDLFLSARNLSMIILYRPSTNKIIKIIEGGFYNQHDVDIIDDKRISIYNNNRIENYKNTRVLNNNEIIIYNFETDSFTKKFEETFKENNINTDTHGLVDFLNDGSAIVEDRNNGRIFYLNSNGAVVWEFNNLDSKKQIYNLWWSRIISLEKSKELRKIIKEIKK